MLDREKIAGQSSHHLDAQDIARLAAPDVPESAVEESMRHLDTCIDCRFQVLESLPRAMVSSGKSGSGQQEQEPVCPPETTWLELAAGILAGESAQRQLEHASNCANCRKLLKAAVEDLATEMTAVEESKVLALESANLEWQNQLANQLSRQSRAQQKAFAKIARFPVSRIFSSSWMRTAAAVLIIAAAWWLWSILRTPSVDTLLAQAYTQSRVMELRIRGAGYAPKRVERGIARSAKDLPQALHDANSMIGRQLQAHPDDPRWLEASAQADLLELNYEAAIQTLRRVLDIQPDSLAAMTDLATAYFQRAEANSDQEVDYGEAIDYLSRVLVRTPDDPVALFNRAISEEKLKLYEPAISDWQHYLKIDSQSGWAEEARKRLDEVQAKVERKHSSLRKPLLSTAEIVAMAGPTQVIDELDSRVEDYLRLALREWLPQAFAPMPSPESNSARIALQALAKVTEEKHEDLWLADLLNGPCRPDCSQAALALAAAVKANESGDYAQGGNAAQRADQLFARAGNLAGQLRAQAEELYSYNFLYDGRHCMALAHSLISTLQPYRYEWLSAQASLEQASCVGLLGDLGTLRTAIDQGTRRAGTHHYPALFLRGLGFQATTDASLGDTQKGFSLASQGLEVFWSGEADLMKGYNLCTDLNTAAETLRLQHLQVILWTQATSLIDLHPNVVRRAMAHQWFGNSAYLAGVQDIAEREYAIASALFAAAPQTEATLRGRVAAEIWLAGLETRHGQLEQAAARLQEVQESIGEIHGFGSRVSFYATKAELGLRAKDFGVAESALRYAVFLSEWGLHSFSSDKTRGQWSQQSDPAYRNLVAWKLLQGDAQAALEFWEWYKGAESRSSYGNPTQTPGGLDAASPPDEQNAPAVQTPTLVQQRLPSLREQTIISYAVLPDGPVTWVYDNRGIFFQRIAVSTAELESRTVQFRRLCSSPDSSMAALRSTARTLYDLLLTPIENRLEGGRTLVFELDNGISAIPMEALIGRDGRYLGESATVAYSAGLYQAIHVHAKVAITPETPVLIVSVPAPPDKRFPPLSEAVSEAQAVAENFHSVRWLNGNDAKLAAILRELRSSAVFHFAGHAAALPEMNGLVLGGSDPASGRSQLLDAQSLNPQAIQALQLAVLSACDTGGAGDDLSISENLVQALFRARVPYVVASRWSVDSVQTARFMHQFYSTLAAGGGVVASLHVAQRALASQPLSAHPYYWAAFGLQGF